MNANRKDLNVKICLTLCSIADDDGHQHFGRPRTSQGPLAPIVPDDQNLPGWVPKNYIEKGEIHFFGLFTIFNQRRPREMSHLEFFD